jgi:hypothetical protein
MLFEAIEVVIAEMTDMERSGPQFLIVHRFSRGICAPGEEISAVFWRRNSGLLQLKIGMAERLVFDFLAQRRIAVDSLQMVSGLAGDWFFREHASNSEQRQIKKIRRATIKVLVQRIRAAMALSFREANVGFDPYNVLRSCPAQDSNRVLYRLCAEIRWQHLNNT